MSKGSPPAPDYTAAAKATGDSALANTQYQTYANRPNVSTPWGGVRWTPPGGGGGGYGGQQPVGDIGTRQFPLQLAGGSGPSGATGNQWGMEMYLSPEQQSQLDTQNRLQAGRGSLAENSLSQASGQLKNPMDWSGLPGAPNAETARASAIDATYRRASSRLDPQWKQREQATDSQLLSQGLRPGMEAYDTAKANLGRERTDAYQTALDSATIGGEAAASGEFGRGLAGRQQGVSEALQRRNQPLNEMMALQNGTSVSMPQMPGFNPAGAAAPTNYSGAARDQYGADLNSYNAGQAQNQSYMQAGMNMLSLAPLFAL